VNYQEALQNIDYSKTHEKQRMKVMSLILQCYNKRFQLVKFELEVNKIKEYIDTVKRAAKESERREKALNA